MIKHIGLMKFRPEAPPEEVASILGAIADLAGSVDGILDISVGPGVGLPVMARGYTHGFVMSFRDMLSLRGYLDHPAHLAVVHRLPDLLDPAPDSALVFNVGAGLAARGPAVLGPASLAASPAAAGMAGNLAAPRPHADDPGMPRPSLSRPLLAGLAWLLGAGCLPGRGLLVSVAEAGQTTPAAKPAVAPAAKPAVAPATKPSPAPAAKPAAPVVNAKPAAPGQANPSGAHATAPAKRSPVVTAGKGAPVIGKASTVTAAVGKASTVTAAVGKASTVNAAVGKASAATAGHVIPASMPATRPGPAHAAGKGTIAKGPTPRATPELAMPRVASLPEPGELPESPATESDEPRPALPEPAMTATAATGYMALSGEACEAELQRRGVPFSSAAGEAPGVDRPIRLGGGMRGVETHQPGPASMWHRSSNEILDCRLALAIDDFSTILARHEVVEVVQVSLYRQNALIARRGTPSQHAAGRALDVATLVKSDGTRLDIRRDWHSVIGDRSCGAQATPPRGSSPEARELRAIACEAAAAGIFHLMLTPSFNRDHHDHLHLDIEPRRVGTEVR